MFRREHLERTHAFYEKHGGKTIIYARFVPIVRTFAPFVAGVGKMDYTRFFSFNVFGGIGWVFPMTMLGYVLGGIPIVKQNLEKAVLLVILISIGPADFRSLKSRPQTGPLRIMRRTDHWVSWSAFFQIRADRRRKAIVRPTGRIE